MKNKEIERKFLLEEKKIPQVTQKNYMEITQGYMQGMGGEYIYRLRQVLNMSADGYNLGEQYFQTIKGKGSKVRDEYEIELLRPQFSMLWPLCKDISLTKKRYEIAIESTIKCHGYLDIYKNTLKGLFTIEVEFENEEDCDNFNPPEWFGREVTDDFDFTNFKLSLNGLPDNFSLISEKKPQEYYDFVNYLIDNYSCVSWGGKHCHFFASHGHTKEDVVVYERGVRGAADWFLFKDGLFEHRGYTNYKQKYNFSAFEEFVKNIEKNNLKWEQEKSQ